tara:strand:+ start:3205 stop:3552 length:348 start_codon:yes stop_codon:yes gene_type:complete
MNVGPVNSGGVSMPMADAPNINAAQPSSDADGGNSGIKQNNAETTESEKEISGGAPKALKQMATSDFLSLKEVSQGENVMDKLEKIFETILALKLLEDTLKNVNESIEETSEGEE